jgi:hypothetical protein
VGADLEAVRVHQGDRAEALASRLGARAVTRDNHIFLGRHQRRDDARLIAHEATHVVQRGTALGPGAPVVPRVNAVPLVQRQEDPGAAGTTDPTAQSFGFGEDEMESRLAATPPEGADASAPTVEVDPSTESTLNDVENEAGEEGAEGAEGAEAEGAEGEREGKGERGRSRGRGEGGVGGGEGAAPVPETPGPAAEFEGLVGADVAAYLEGNLSDERLAALDPRTQELLGAVDALGDRSITDPEAGALQGLTGEGLQPGAPTDLYAGEPAWLRTVAAIRDVTGQLGGIVGIIGLVATVSGFILSLLIPPVGAFLLTVGRFCDIAALVLDAISLVLGIILTGYNLYRLKNETNPDERRRLLGMVRQDAMGTVMSAVAVATAVAPGAGRALGRAGRRVSSGLRAASRSATVIGRGARALRVAGVSGRLALRAGRRGLRTAGRSVAGGFRRLSQSSSLLGRAARGVRVAGVSGRLALRTTRRAVGARATQILGWARGTAPVRWANRLGGQAEEWARLRLRGLAAGDSAIGRFYNRRLRGFHERNVMVARSISDPIERAYQQRLGRELVTELNALRQANPTWTAQQLDDALRARFGRERYGHAEVGTTRAGNIQFVRDDADFLRQIRETEFAEIQLIRDLHPNASAREMAEAANRSPFIKGRWTEEEMQAFASMHPSRRPTGELALRDAGGEALAVPKTGHHTIPASMAPQISQDPRFIQIVNDSRFYRDFIDRSYPGMTHIPEVRGYRVPGARPGRMRNAANRREVIEHMLDQGQIPGYTRADINYFMGRGLADDLVADGSTGIWRNRRSTGQTMFFNPHLGIGHEWNWSNDVARQVFNMDSRLGLNLRRELGDQFVAPLLRRSGHLAGDAASGDRSARDRSPNEQMLALIDRSIQARAVAQRAQAPAAQLPPLFEPLPREFTSGDGGADVALPGIAGSLDGPSSAPDMLDQPGSGDGMDGTDAALMDGFGPQEQTGVPMFMMGAGTMDESAAPGQSGPEPPPSPVPYSPLALVSIREQRTVIADAIAVVTEYIGETQEAEQHNRHAQEAAGTLKERNAEQGSFAQGQRDTVAKEQDKLTQASGAQENMAAENARASGDADRANSQAEGVQAEGQNVSVEPKPEEPKKKSWLERAWDATAGALWDRLIAPAVRAVRRKVSEVMQSVNDFIMRMINQALGLDEIEAELEGGGQDIQGREASLTETDTGLQETRDQAAQEEERNQQSMEQADANITESQTTREDAQALLADLTAHNEALSAEESAGQSYVVDVGARYQPFFEEQAGMGDEGANTSMPPAASEFEGANDTGFA